MSDPEPDLYDEQEVERERGKSFELGHVSQLESVAEDLRERAGEVYAQADTRTETKKAKWLKDLAKEYEEKAEERREQYDQKYK